MSTRKSGYIFPNTENLYPQTIIILFRTPSLSSCCTYTVDVGAIDIILLYFVRQKSYITITLFHKLKILLREILHEHGTV